MLVSVVDPDPFYAASQPWRQPKTNVPVDRNPVARFTVLPAKPLLPGREQPSGTLQLWYGSFTYNGQQYNYHMVGADPATNRGALITTWIIPVKIILSDGSTWDPLSGGPFSPLARTALSPIFERARPTSRAGLTLARPSTSTLISAPTSGASCRTIRTRMLLGGPTRGIETLPSLTLNVPAQYGHQGQEYAHTVALVDLNYLDEQITSYLAANQTINPMGFPIF
jgi:hypothetical protein